MGLLSSEGLAGAVGSASKMPPLMVLAGDLSYSLHEPVIGLLVCLYDMALASSRVSSPRQKGMQKYNVFIELGLKECTVTSIVFC